jgi:hypothetical protein
VTEACGGVQDSFTVKPDNSNAPLVPLPPVTARGTAAGVTAAAAAAVETHARAVAAGGVRAAARHPLADTLLALQVRE